MDLDGCFSRQHPLVCRVLPLTRRDGRAVSVPSLPPLLSSPGEGRASGREAVYLRMCRASHSSSSLPLRNLGGDLAERSSVAEPAHRSSPPRAAVIFQTLSQSPRALLQVSSSRQRPSPDGSSSRLQPWPLARCVYPISLALPCRCPCRPVKTYSERLLLSPVPLFPGLSCLLML